jgi:hypothetical protein
MQSIRILRPDVFEPPVSLDKSMCTVDWDRQSGDFKVPWWTVEAQLQRDWIGEPMVDVSCRENV